MKVIIWISTFFVGTLLNTLIGYAIGIRAGAVLLYIAEYFVAKKLCEKWDEHKRAKETSADESYAGQELPTEIIPDTQEISKQVEIINEHQTLGVEEPPTYKTISYCRRCGFKLIDGSEFCSNCGTQIEKESDI